MVTITVQPAVSAKTGKPAKPSFTVELPEKSAELVTVKDLKKAIQAKNPKLLTVRQRLTIPGSSKDAKPTVLSFDGATLASVGIPEKGGSVTLKDLGPQLGWRTVYLWEYLGPIVIHPLLYYMSHKQGWNLPYLLHKLGIHELAGYKVASAAAKTYEPSGLQKMVLALIVMHFLKREYETAFVHIFSNATMPFRNIYKNCGHYWALSGLFIASAIYQPGYSSSALTGDLIDSKAWIGFWTLVWVWGEFSNYLTHLNLRSIRTPPGQPRKFPTGYGFNSITCANYFFEAVSWFAISVMTGGNWAVVIFSVVGIGQMAEWAAKKHATYRKEHGKAYPKRWKMIPFLF